MSQLQVDPQTTAESASTETELPPYTRNLLRIRVPVMVTLARKKQPVKSIVELVPGAIIQFNKSCEEMLDMHVGDQNVAQGEAVKVGDRQHHAVSVNVDERLLEHGIVEAEHLAQYQHNHTHLR